MKENLLELKSVNQLFDYSFCIPSYQRGYRWDSNQVTQLLDDIWQFAQNPPKHSQDEEPPFYCLQPLIVKKKAENVYEVIDGQQRLTTIYLILKNLSAQIEKDNKNIKRIFYETRLNSEQFLDSLDLERSKDNVDFFHIYEASRTIHNWFQKIANETDDPSPRASLAPTFLRKTKVVWYEITDENIDPIEVFTRVNIGKIPLTNSELIKALFLQKENFNENSVSLKQIQIASEWDQIERVLQNDSFWFFLYNPDSMIKYENRIEYIFDSISKKKKDSDFYFTFFHYQNELTNYKKKNADKEKGIEDLWLEIKQYFLRLEEWYMDHELYHLIGFLISTGHSINVLKADAESRTKIEYKEHLNYLISQKLKGCDLEKLEYGDKLTRPVLLLFNIHTIISSKNHEIRFPFNKYKVGSWDIEHVRSRTDKKIVAGERKKWAEDILEYFEGEKSNILDADEEVKAYCDRLSKIIEADKVNDEVFGILYEDILKFFNEAGVVDEINSISNLALLDAETNRSYKNAMFPIKRKRIIENDKKGVFIPICTKNLFLKYYSSKLSNVMYWQEHDASDYLMSMKKSLETYL